MTIKESEPLSRHSTFKIGGPAKFFAEAASLADVRGALKFAREKNLKILVLGCGSNVLFSDEGFDGLVVKMSNVKCQMSKPNRLVCNAGAPVDDALGLAIKHGLSGLEWAGGLPGTVGGGVRGNAGAFGGEMKDAVEKIVAVDGLGQVKIYTNRDCQFGYRDSIFKRNGEIIVEVVFALKPVDKNKLQTIADEHISYRKTRHPLEYPNAGSIFKNIPVPKVSPQLREKWRDVIKIDPFPVIPTAKIIADAGLAGLTVGKAQVSTKHTNYIVNLGGATAENVKELIKLVRNKVKAKFGIELEPEVQIL